VSVLEHVAQQLLHGGVADGPAEEEQLHTLRGDEAQRREEQQQLPESGGWSGGREQMFPPLVSPLGTWGQRYLTGCPG